MSTSSQPSVWPAWEAFRQAAEARRRDLHDAAKAEALREARAAFDAALVDVLALVPYRTRKVGDLRPGRGGGRVHLTPTSAAKVEGTRWREGQTLCGEPAGRAASGRPVTCPACLRLVERHVGREQDAPELPL